jgi:methionyl aminopeptidase
MSLDKKEDNLSFEKFIRDWKKAGEISKDARNLAYKLTENGTSILDICEKVENFILKSGAKIAFPLNCSLDEFAAHDSADIDDDRIIDGNVVKLDIGASVNGAIGDTAVTKDLTGKYDDLLDANKKALDVASDFILNTKSSEIEVNDIGTKIEEVAKKNSVNPIYNLTGHGLSINKIHDEPSIPNFNSNRSSKIKNNSFFAVEPFFTNGEGRVIESGIPKIFSQISHKNVRHTYARKILSQLSDFEGKPFSLRWLNGTKMQVKLGLRELKKANIIREYPPLKEVSNGIVSQFEHSFFFSKEKSIILTKD